MKNNKSNNHYFDDFNKDPNTDKNKSQQNRALRYIVPSFFILALLLLLVLMFLPEVSRIVSAATPRTSPSTRPSPSHTAQQTFKPTPAATPGATPAKTKTPTSAATPDLNAQYFTASGETVNVNSDKTEWMYSSPELYIDIKKYDKPDIKLHYFVADIRTRGNTIFKSGFSDESHPGSNALLPNLVAEKLKAVFLLNGDYFEDTRNPSGVVIRHGVVYRDNKKADTLAIMPDGTLKVFSAGEIKAVDLLALGVQDTFSFGPYLINNSVINPNLSKARLERANPRTGIGMIEKGHYIAIVVEGRNPQDNRGVTFEEYAQMFADLGCTVAYNFDGGASSAMVFMGNTLNLSTEVLATKTYRRVPDVLTIGTSNAAPAYK